MTWLRVFAFRVRSLFGATRLDRDLAEELQSHIEMETEANLQRGMSPAEATRAARLQFGGVTQTAETYREHRGLPFIEALFQDVRYAMRVFRKTPGFTSVAILSLALGIGLNTAIFSLVNALLLRPLPVKDPGQLVTLLLQHKGSFPLPIFSYPDYRDVREQTTNLFSGILGYTTGLDGLSIDGRAERVLNHYVTGNYFAVLGLKPALGRLILPAEGEVEGADPVLVLSYTCWQTRFGADAGVIGKKVLINGHPVTIIGVAPKEFRGTQGLIDVQGFLPMSMTSISNSFVHAKEIRSLRTIYLLGRLAPGVTLSQAQSRLSVVSKNLAAANPKDMEGVAVRANWEPLARLPGASETLVPTSSIFLAMAALVLLLACINLANLVMVRATARQKEIAMRAALGGSRVRLIRQMLTESFLLAFFGALAGLLVGAWTCSALTIWKMQGVPLYLDFSFDGRVFAYAFAAAVVTGVTLGMLPALRASRADLAAVSRETRRQLTGGRQRLRSVLVVAQVAGSFVLLIVAVLLSRSLHNMRRLDLGFDPQNVVNFSMDPHNVGYDEAQGRRFYKDLLQRVRALPGVESAGLAVSGPMSAYPLPVQVQIDGYVPPPGQSAPTIFYDLISSDYFKTLRMPVVRGRAFAESDDQKAPRVAMTNQTTAERFWPGQDPIGKRLDFFGNPGRWMQIVGVVADTRYLGVAEAHQPYFFVPLEQNYASIQTLRVRSRGTPDILMQEVQKEIGALAPGLPVAGVETMIQQLDSSAGYISSRVLAGFGVALGLLGLALALIGLYGVVSYSAAQRMHEIGVRMTLGAQPRDVRKMILSQGFIIVCAGLVLGLLLSFAAAPVVRTLLVGVGATDPVTFLAVSALLAVVTLGACYIPVHRALRVDPMVVLRHE